MSSTLYRKYRPKGWSEVAGQEHIKKILAYEVASGRTVHAYLFSGPRGVGKTTTARIFAKAVNCLNKSEGSGEPCGSCEACRVITEGSSLDIIEIDAASNRGIDNVRENIIENARFSPVMLTNKVFIIDEVHMLTTEAFNALLKTLEEPPNNVIFLLATTELQKVPVTVVSRCQRFDFRKIPIEDVVERLAGIAVSEGIKIEREVLTDIARRTEGCLRDAEGLLGKILSTVDGGEITTETARMILPRSDWEAAASLIDALIVGNTATALSVIGEYLDQGVEPEHLIEETVEVLRQTLITKVSGDIDLLKTKLDESRLARINGWTKQIKINSLVRALEILLEKRRDMKGGSLPQLPLELAAVLICEEVSSSNSGLSKTAGINNSMSPIRPLESQKPIESTKNVKENLVQQETTQDKISNLETENLKKVEADASNIKDVEELSVKTELEEISSVNEVDTNPVVTRSVSLEEVIAEWEKIVKQATEVSQSLSLLLGAVSPVKVEGEVLELGSAFPFYRDRLSEDKTRLVLEDVLRSIFGCKILIRAVSIEKSDDFRHNNVAANPAPSNAPTEAPSGVQKIAEAFGGHVVG